MEGTKWVDRMKNEEVRTRIKKIRALFEYNTEKKRNCLSFIMRKGSIKLRIKGAIDCSRRNNGTGAPGNNSGQNHI